MDIDYRFYVSAFFVFACTIGFLIGMNMRASIQRWLVVSMALLGLTFNALPICLLFGWFGILTSIGCVVVGLFVYYRFMES